MTCHDRHDLCIIFVIILHEKLCEINFSNLSVSEEVSLKGVSLLKLESKIPEYPCCAFAENIRFLFS